LKIVINNKRKEKIDKRRWRRGYQSGKVAVRALNSGPNSLVPHENSNNDSGV
jgi:hypothetical protein